MPYELSIKYLETLPRFANTIGLHRIKKILQLLGNPERNLKYVHVTGTNGKGSTSATIESILRQAGYKTGLFTSPHLFEYNERIKVNGDDISEEDFSKNLSLTKAVVEKMVNEDESMKPALFEVLLAIAFLHFQEKKIDIAVLEVGIGGLVDSTNVIDALVAVITNVDLEHTEVLGDTKEKIAEQKAGIIKNGAAVLTADTDTKVIDTIARIAREKNATLELVKPEDLSLIHQNLEGQVFNFRHYKNLQITFLGNYQLYNTALAILAAEALNNSGFKISEEAIRNGLKNVYWPLRLEIVHKNPTVLIDVGHNLHGVATIHQVMRDLFPKFRKILVLGASYDKPYNQMASILGQEADIVILTKAQYHGAEPAELAKNVNSSEKEVILTTNVKEAMLQAKEIANENDLIMVLGGLYLGAEAKKIVEEVF